MGSKTKTKTSQQQGKKGIFGMGPGQSQAMAGNTGLAGATEAQALQIQKGLQNLGQPSSFQSIGQNIGEVGSKYRRPADIESYADKMQKLNQALDAGGKFFTAPDGIERVNLANTGIKDEQGRTVLSMMSPELTATAPTMGELGGDIARAFTGYNSLQYTDPASNVPEMVQTQGLGELLAKVATPGSLALNIIQDLYGKGKNFLSPAAQLQPDPFSSGADATGGAFTLAQSLIPQDIERENITPIDKRARLKELINLDVAPGSQELNVDGMTDQEVDLRLQSYGEPLAVGGRVGFSSGGDIDQDRIDYEEGGYDKIMTFDQYLLMLDELQQESKNESFYKIGGLVPPTSGPESEGIESLFRNK